MKTTPATAKFIIDPELDLSFLDGRRIIRVGTIDCKDIPVSICDGRLAIDYEVEVDGKTMRAVIGGNELGMWISWHGEIGKERPDDILRLKVDNAYAELCENIDATGTSIVRTSYGGRSIRRQDGSEILFLEESELAIVGKRFPSVLSAVPMSKADVKTSIDDILCWSLIAPEIQNLK